MTRDRGSMTIVGVGVLGATLTIGLALAAIAGALAQRAEARAGADLAALAGAYAVRASLDGSGEAPCEVAALAASRNDTLLVSCEAFGDGSVQVTVASGGAVASARAGPQAEAGQGPGGGSG